MNYTKIVCMVLFSFVFCIFATSCEKINFKKKQNENYIYYPYIPDTNAYPELNLKWEHSLDNSNVVWLGAFGVWEGVGAHVEIAGEIEIHPLHGDEYIYAMSDGIVVEIQTVANHGDPIVANQIEGIWVRYGRNFLMKYVHVGFPTVKDGDIIRKGQVLGKTVEFNGEGFWEIATFVNDSGRTFAVCPYNHLDAETHAILTGLWNDNAIARTSVPDNSVPWCTSERIDSTNTVNSKFWIYARKI